MGGGRSARGVPPVLRRAVSAPLSSGGHTRHAISERDAPHPRGMGRASLGSRLALCLGDRRSRRVPEPRPERARPGRCSARHVALHTARRPGDRLRRLRALMAIHAGLGTRGPKRGAGPLRHRRLAAGGRHDPRDTRRCRDPGKRGFARARMGGERHGLPPPQHRRGGT